MYKFPRSFSSCCWRARKSSTRVSLTSRSNSVSKEYSRDGSLPLVSFFLNKSCKCFGNNDRMDGQRPVLVVLFRILLGGLLSQKKDESVYPGGQCAYSFSENLSVNLNHHQIMGREFTRTSVLCQGMKGSKAWLARAFMVWFVPFLIYKLLLKFHNQNGNQN
jgi:hypothetical protein